MRESRDRLDLGALLVDPCVFGMGDAAEAGIGATIREEATNLFELVRNSVKLATTLVSSMVSYVVGTLRITSLDEVEKDDPDEMEELATEAWQLSFGEDLPRVHGLRVRKWAGEASLKPKKETLASHTSVGDVNAEDRRSAAKMEASSLSYLTPFEKETVVSDMAAQGLSCERIVSLSLSMVMGKVSKLSVSENMKWGEDPALTDVAKQARKAGKKLLANVLAEENFATTASFFSDVMRSYAALGMVEESSLIASWWAETTGCFNHDKGPLFKYLEAYFEKYAGRGLPERVDTVLITRTRNQGADGSGVSKEDFTKMKKRLEEIEKANSNLKSEVGDLKKKVADKNKPTKEEQEERRKKVKCHHCGELGHYQSECPNKNSDE